jgi:large subunit ribosomal protein L24
MKIKSGDTVLIMSGKDKGKSGKVAEVFPKDKKIMVENLNLVKKHVKPKKSGEKGQIVEVSRPIDASNVKLICSQCKRPVRVGYKLVPGAQNNKVRICRKCRQEV